VLKTNPLTGRWIAVSGGQAAFIEKCIEDGMLGAAEAHKITADTDHEETGSMYLRINQFGDNCTVDASVAKYACAKRTWRSGHYFYKPLVSGGNLLGVWVLPEEYHKRRVPHDLLLGYGLPPLLPHRAPRTPSQ